MRSLLLLVVCTAGALLAGPLLTPMLHASVPPFSGMQFHKAAALATELAAVVAILLYLYLTAGISRANLGLGFTFTDLRKDLPAALLGGLLLVAVLESVLLLLGIRVPAALDASAAAVTRALLIALAVGLVVALIEEALIRGALFSGLRSGASAATAVIVSSAVYAGIHFVKFVPLRAGMDLDWATGLALLEQGILRRFSNPIIIDSFLTLFALGVLLGLMRLARGHVAQCIGFHAGVVAGLRLAGEWTDRAKGAQYEFLVNRWDPERGWLAFGFLAAIALAYGLLQGRGVRR